MERESFEYTYSAPEQEELRRIREKYIPRVESNLEKARRLDAGVTQKAAYRAILVGVIGTLTMGSGMSMCLVWTTTLLIPGIVLGILGMALMAAALPVYHRTLDRERQRVAPEILRLTQDNPGQ